MRVPQYVANCDETSERAPGNQVPLVTSGRVEPNELKEQKITRPSRDRCGRWLAASLAEPSVDRPNLASARHRQHGQDDSEQCVDAIARGLACAELDHGENEPHARHAICRT